MTEVLYNPKIKPEHLARKAIVYLRQSSDKQVRQNKESQLLQYAVAERVRALGWKQVEIINCDLGSSAGLASAQREGFERVLSLVALGEVGIVLALHGVLQPDRPAGDRPAAGAVRCPARAHRRWIPDLGPVPRAPRRRGDAVSTGRAARKGAAVVRSQATGRNVI